MTAWRTVMDTIQQDLTSILSGANATVGIGWPGQAALQDIVRTGNPLVSVYDTKVAKDTSRFMGFSATAPSGPTPGTSLTLSNPILPVDGVITITGSGTPIVNDALGISVNNGVSGATYVALATQSLATILSNFSSAINTANLGFTSTVTSDTELSLANNSTIPYFIEVNTANQQSSLFEVRREQRQIQIVVWAPDEVVRETLGVLIEQRFSYLQYYFGYAFPDGTYGRLTFLNDENIEDDMLQNVYRRDFLIGIDYGIQLTNTGYPVLAPVLDMVVSNTI